MGAQVVNCYLPGLGGPSYSSEAVALFARMSVQPDDTRKGLIDDCIVALKSAGVWAKLECLWFTAAHDAQAAQRNWIQNAFNLAPVNSPTFTTDRGYAGDGSTSYLNTGWNSAGASIASRNSMSLGGYLNAGTDAVGVERMMGGTTAMTSFLNVSPFYTGNVIRGGVNSPTQDTFGTVATRLGFTALSRTAINVLKAYRNGVQSGTTKTSTSGTRPSEPLALCGNSDTGVFQSAMNNRFAMAFTGAGLTNAEVSDLYDATETFLTALGANA